MSARLVNLVDLDGKATIEWCRWCLEWEVSWLTVYGYDFCESFPTWAKAWAWATATIEEEGL